MKQKNKLALGTSILAALASSMCCIAPLLSIIGGASGGAATFSWIAPYRPYLIVLAVITLGFSFYQAYRPKTKDSCGCDENKQHFLQSKRFLWIITIISIGLFTFPYYSGIFYSETQKKQSDIPLTQLHLKIEGMTCKSCEHHVNSAALEMEGVAEAYSSYNDGTALIKYLPDSINPNQIIASIQKSTGYTVEIKNEEK